MNDEIDGPSPEEMGLDHNDIKPETPEPDKSEKSPEELSEMAKKVFGDEPVMLSGEDALPKIGKEAGDILEKYNFGTDLDDQFHADIVRLSGEQVYDRVVDIPGKLRAGYFTEEQLKDHQNTDENREKWWVEAAYRLLRERQGNPVDDRETVKVLVEAMRPHQGTDQYDRLTGAMVEKSSKLLKKYDFGINPDVRLLSEIVEYSWLYETSTSTEIYPDAFGDDKGMAERLKVSFDRDEGGVMKDLQQDFLDRHK